MAHWLYRSIEIRVRCLGVICAHIDPRGSDLWWVLVPPLDGSSTTNVDAVEVWYGIQSFTGGLLVSTILSTIFPSYQHMKNTLPASASMTTKQFVGFVLYNISAKSFPFYPCCT